MGRGVKDIGVDVAVNIQSGGRTSRVARVLSRNKEAAWWGREMWGPRGKIH